MGKHSPLSDPYDNKSYTHHRLTGVQDCASPGQPSDPDPSVGDQTKLKLVSPVHHVF